MTNQYIALGGGVMSFIGILIIIAQLGQPAFFAYQGMILGAVFLGLGVVVIAISALVSDNKKSLYFCKHCKFAAAELADLYNHSVKEHDDDVVEAFENEYDDSTLKPFRPTLDYEQFIQARKFVRSLGLKNLNEWHAYCNSTKNMDNIPREPWNACANYWRGVDDWLKSEEAQVEELKEVEKLKTRNPYKAKGVIIGIFTVFLVIVLLGNLSLVVIMQGDKMSPLIEDNDLIYRFDIPISEIDYNDIIIYTSSGKLMVNKVVGIIADDRVDYIFTVKNTASPTIKKVTEEQYVGKMIFVLGNIGENGGDTLRMILNPVIIILLPVIGFIVPIIVMRHRAKINV